MNDKVDFTYEQLHDVPLTDRERPFHDIVDILGPMTHVTPVSREEAEKYRGRLPDGLIQFWLEHGRGALLKGYLWICDPELLRPVLDAAFEGDPVYSADDFDCCMYDYDGRIFAWSKQFNLCKLNLSGFEREVSIDGEGPTRDVDGREMTDDLALGHAIRVQGYSLSRDMNEQYTDYHLFSSASNRLGLLEPGEIFGFFPSRQMGGEGYPEDMRKAGIVEHLLFHLQLGPATLIEWQKDPNNPDNPLLRPVPVRLLGPQ